MAFQRQQSIQTMLADYPSVLSCCALKGNSFAGTHWAPEGVRIAGGAPTR